MSTCPPNPDDLILFDGVCRLAMTGLRAPVVRVILNTDARARFLGATGTILPDTPGEFRFNTALESAHELVTVEDATVDLRLKDHDLVCGSTSMRFYLAAPIWGPARALWGQVTALDVRPRQVTPAMGQTLMDAAHLASTLLGARIAGAEAEARAQGLAAQITVSESAMRAMRLLAMMGNADAVREAGDLSRVLDTIDLDNLDEKAAGVLRVTTRRIKRIVDSSETMKTLETDQPATQVGRAVVVDDNAGVRRFLTTCLEAWGFEVFQIESSHDAAEEIGRQRPDLVLLDLRMPGLSGEEVAAAVRKRDGAIRTQIIAVSANPIAPEHQHLFEAVVPKPVSPHALFEAVTQCYSEARGR